MDVGAEAASSPQPNQQAASSAPSSFPTSSAAAAASNARTSVGSVNRVLLVGNVGKDPVTRQMSRESGSTVTVFPLATNELPSASRRQQQAAAAAAAGSGTQWHNVAIYDPRLGEIIQNSCRRGHQVYVEGKLQSRSWTDAKGVSRVHYEVAVNPFKGAVVILNRPAGTTQGSGSGVAAAAAAGGNGGGHGSVQGAGAMTQRRAAVSRQPPPQQSQPQQPPAPEDFPF